MHRWIVLLTGIVVVLALPAFAHAAAGTIDLFSDPDGGNCMIVDQVPGLMTVYALHRNTQYAAAVQFGVAGDAGFRASFVSMTAAPSFLMFGTTPDDISIAYAGCFSGSFPILTLVYQGSGTSTACSHLWVVPAPTSPVPGEIAVLDECSFNVAVGATWGPLVVNYLPQCPAWCVMPVEPSTWGGVKALYR